MLLSLFVVLAATSWGQTVKLVSSGSLQPSVGTRAVPNLTETSNGLTLPAAAPALTAALPFASALAPVETIPRGTLETLTAVGAELKTEKPRAARNRLEQLYSGAAAEPKAGRFVEVGETKIDTKAPGAAALIAAIREPSSRVVIGLFQKNSGEILNALPANMDGIEGHRDLLPAIGIPKRELGGYSFGLKPDGGYLFFGSGFFQNGQLSKAVQRGILRYLGVRPARETLMQRLKRGFWRIWDGWAG